MNNSENEATTVTVVMRSDSAIDDDLLAQIQLALENNIDDAQQVSVEQANTLGMESREILITVLITYGATVAANLTSTGITEILQSDKKTESVIVVEIVQPEPATNGQQAIESSKDDGSDS